ncbi:MmgE/PrpD family protein [Microbulbifer hydrolyticus]|uniref:2-methylcitrate dehydratase PrpD n=1 Tax=Microbulbifer hydrolyticus TaxID=48074 RepID=A0A6P1TF11_9GAMM|nr:MmgE/PrpD family protein [Microbulbifer hydrolyticus]MBB5210130.1 2-methylcitrate dehydratase PrpD [Microbulbifer hydrolyticus]QHQ39352.1 MmgE/PrpD family protein [Microbulbifer hydrolyticus]
MRDFEQQLVGHVAGANFADLDDAAIAACKTFILDSIGVGISGSRLPLAAELLGTAAEWGSAATHRAATVWGSDVRLPAAHAAMVNAYQIHNQEFDCVHERAVVHPMAVILSALLADAEAREADGRSLLLALALAVDVATVLGMSASKPMRFFRPGTAGCIGAAAGIARLRGYDREKILQSMSIAYSQTGGTMQAHTEGVAVLPMQVAFNARNAIAAADMAGFGLEGPRRFLSGAFGYFSIMESDGNAESAFSLLGGEWQIVRVSHKPFPTGRAAHGTLDALTQLRAAHGFAASDIESVIIAAPPLVRRLVDRPAQPGMSVNYARLCIGYVAATLLLSGDVGVEDFDPAALADPVRQNLAARITMTPSASKDPNALAPQTVTVRLNDGTEYRRELTAILGHPENPLDRSRQLAKFRRCLGSARTPFDAETGVAIIARIERLEQLASVSELTGLLASLPQPVDAIT